MQYIYTENSDEPLARVDSHGQHAEIYWYHTELNGLPESVTDSNGDTIRRWSRSLRVSVPVAWDTPQNLPFQGSTWTTKRACTTTPSAATTRRADATRRWIRLVCWVALKPIPIVVDPLGWVDPLGLLPCAKKIHALRTGGKNTIVEVRTKRKRMSYYTLHFPVIRRSRELCRKMP